MTDLWTPDEIQNLCSMIEAIDEAIKKEREACAKVAEDCAAHRSKWHNDGDSIAAAIRARGK